MLLRMITPIPSPGEQRFGCDQVPDRLHAQRERHACQQKRLNERRNGFGLPVSEPMPGIGRALGIPHADKRDQRGHHIDQAIGG